MSIRQQIRIFILTNYLFTEDEAALADGISLMRSGIVDSTGILELIAHVEESFNIQIVAEEMIPDNFDSVERIAEFVSRKLQSM
jgi:acyl carrier protein